MIRKGSLLGAVLMLCAFQNTRGLGHDKELNSQYAVHMGGETSQANVCQSMQCWGLKTLVRLEKASAETKTVALTSVKATLAKGGYYRKDSKRVTGLFKLSQNISEQLDSQDLNTKE